jgi:O-antigen/teichoic acid export membrane protein
MTRTSGFDIAPAPAVSDGLTSRVVKGAGWTLGSKVFGQVLDFAKLAVMGGILSQRDVGLFGIVGLAYVTLETFSQTGFTTALVQKKEETAHYLDTAWTVSGVRGIILAVILFLAAPLVAWYFEEPQTVAMLRVISLSAILNGFTSVGLLYLQKDMDFRKQFVFEAVGVVASFVVFVVLIYTLRSVWAFVWSNVAGYAARCALSYVLHPYRPRPRADREQMRELFGFGRWVLGQTIFIFLWQQGSQVFMGKVLSTAALGLFMAASRINSVGTQISLVTGNVMFPAFAKVQDDKSRLGRGFLDLMSMIMSLVMPITLFVILVAPDLLQALLPKWVHNPAEAAEAVLVFQVLAVVGLLRAIETTSPPLFIGVGKPHLEAWKHVCCLVAMGACIYPLSKGWDLPGLPPFKGWGLPGACVAMAIGSLATLPIWQRVRAEAHISWSAIGRSLLPGVALGGAVALAVLGWNLLFKSQVMPGIPWVESSLRISVETARRLLATGSLVMAAALSLGMYVALAWFLGKQHQVGPYPQIQRAWRSLRGR